MPRALISATNPTTWLYPQRGTANRYVASGAPQPSLRRWPNGWSNAGFGPSRSFTLHTAPRSVVARRSRSVSVFWIISHLWLRVGDWDLDLRRDIHSYRWTGGHGEDRQPARSSHS